MIDIYGIDVIQTKVITIVFKYSGLVDRSRIIKLGFHGLVWEQSSEIEEAPKLAISD